MITNSTESVLTTALRPPLVRISTIAMLIASERFILIPVIVFSTAHDTVN